MEGPAPAALVTTRPGGDPLAAERRGRLAGRAAHGGVPRCAGRGLLARCAGRGLPGLLARCAGRGLPGLLAWPAIPGFVSWICPRAPTGSLAVPGLLAQQPTGLQAAARLWLGPVLAPGHG
jgi:hypothetical protein